MVRSFILMKMVPFQAHQLIHSHKKQQILLLILQKIMLPMIQQKQALNLLMVI